MRFFSPYLTSDQKKKKALSEVNDYAISNFNTVKAENIENYQTSTVFWKAH